jgi:hypothetical protein
VKRRLVLPLAAGAVVVALVPVAFLRDSSSSAGDSSSRPPSVHGTATVTKRDISQTLDADGTLAYGTETDLAFGRPGTITALPAVGTTVDRGGELAEIDGGPVVLLFGDRPMWRDLQEGVSDGPDVEQLEANLIALGYGTEAALGPNQTWTDATTAAVKRWQHALEVDESGVVTQGAVVFKPAAVRIAEHATEPGGNASGPVLKVTSPTKQIAVSLSVKRRSLVSVGQAVRIQLPDGTMTDGTITAVGAVAHEGQQGSDPTVDVTVALNDASVAGSLEEAPVTVKITTTSAQGVLAVPVSALLALTEGGYAVERVNADGTTTLVGVQLGPFADGWVQVSGVNEGDKVVTPR